MPSSQSSYTNSSYTSSPNTNSPNTKSSYTQNFHRQSGITHRSALFLALACFFVISLMTNVFGPIFPALIRDFNISLTLAGFFPLAFFGAYFFVSIPAGLLIERFGVKPVIALAFLIAALGSYWMYRLPNFISALVGLFALGVAMAMLQVAVNPLLRTAGGRRNYPFYAVLAQLLFGVASALSPWLYSFLVSDQPGVAMAWLPLYGVFAAIAIGMLLLALAVRLPDSINSLDYGNNLWQLQKGLIKRPAVWCYFFAIVCYVASEQGIANVMSVFLLHYHGYDPDSTGARAVSLFWLLMTIGCLTGLALLKVFPPRRVLQAAVAMVIVSLLVAIFAKGPLALIAFPACGFFLSVIWPLIFALALNSFDKDHAALTGILCTGVVGGAMISPLIGVIADSTGNLRLASLVILLCLGYLWWLAHWAGLAQKTSTIAAPINHQ